MMNTKDITVLSVTELTQSLKSIIESQFRFVHIQGEVSNLRVPYSGHMYFTLKDSGASIKAVLFKGQQRYLARNIEEGQNIICNGRISIYEARGEYQILVDTVDFKGTGHLYIQYEILKKQLSEKGFFAQERKKEIPPYPEDMVIITSPTGAAVYDFLKIATMRKYWGKISIIPVAVQGKNSASEISEAIRFANTALATDLIVLIRGGGSLEDLWSFNEEVVARAIFQSATPIVTGIGHETDLSIADLCADLHTHTPTAAAESIIPDVSVLLDIIAGQKRNLVLDIEHFLDEKENEILQIRRIIGDLDLYLSNYNLQLDHQISSLLNVMHQRLSCHFSKVELFMDRLQSQATDNKISMQQLHIKHLHNELCFRIQRKLESKQDRLSKQAALLDAASPLSILARGYSIVSKEKKDSGDFEIVSNSDQVAINDSVNIRLHKGELMCLVKGKSSN